MIINLIKPLLLSVQRFVYLMQNQTLSQFFISLKD